MKIKKFSNMDKMEWLKTESRIRNEVKWDALDDGMLTNIKIFLESLNKASVGKIRTILDIHYNHPFDYINQMKIFLDPKSSFKDRTIAHYGESHWIKKIDDTKARVKSPGYSQFSEKYWIDKGFDPDSAKSKVKEIQSKNGKKAHERSRPHSMWNTYSTEFWVSRGYSFLESVDLVERQKWKSSPSLARDIERYGDISGPVRFAEKHAKRVATMIAKYGTAVVCGKTSKESLKFFLPLYKKLRRLGIESSDIFWGISGSREYAMHHAGANYFYDFTIHSKKIIIEYNNRFWHPRELEEWCGFGDYDAKKTYDAHKLQVMRDRGYEVIIVWDDDDFAQKTLDIIKATEHG